MTKIVWRVAPAVPMVVGEYSTTHGAQLLVGEPDDRSFTSNPVADDLPGLVVDDHRVLAVTFPAHGGLEPAGAGVDLGRDRQDQAVAIGRG